MELGLRFLENDFLYFSALFLYYVYVSFTNVYIILYCLRHVLFLYRCFGGVFGTIEISGMDRFSESS